MRSRHHGRLPIWHWVPAYEGESATFLFSFFTDLATDGRTLGNRVFLPRTLRGRWNFANVSRIALFPIRGNPVRILLYSTRNGYPRISRCERNTAEWNVTVNTFNRADDIRRLIFCLMRFERRRDPGVGNINDSLRYCSNFVRIRVCILRMFAPIYYAYTISYISFGNTRVELLDIYRWLMSSVTDFE